MQQTTIDPKLGVPRELSMASLPQYRIEPPDIVTIEAIKLVPRPPYHISVYDVLQIRAVGTLLDQPIDNYFMVEDKGTVNLGPAYGEVLVEGLTIDQATDAIVRRLKMVLQNPAVSVQLSRSAGMQQINGAYKVQPDGMVNLRDYGMVHIAGKTVAEAQTAIEQQVGRFFESPQVSVDVVGYNSKTYYVIIAGAGMGDSMQRFPITGNETVLDAISNIQGLRQVSSKVMWVARPAPPGIGGEEVFPVDWTAIARGGMTDTNYQLLPGDRVYIVDDKLIATDSLVARFTTPMGRLFNISSLGSSMVNGMQTLGRFYNANRN